MVDREESDGVRLPRERSRSDVVGIDDRLGDDECARIGQHTRAFGESAVAIRYLAQHAHEQDPVDAAIGEGKRIRAGAHETEAALTETAAKVLQHRWLKVEADQSRVRVGLEQRPRVQPTTRPDLDNTHARFEREMLDEPRRRRSQAGNWNVEKKGETRGIRRRVAAPPGDRHRQCDNDPAENPHWLPVRAIGR